MTNYCLGHIDIDEPGQEAKLEAEISKVFHSYLNNIDQDCLGLSDKSIINTHASEGVAVSTTSPHFCTFLPQIYQSSKIVPKCALSRLTRSWMTV